MDKVRVYQLAKELKVQSALILELLDRLGREVKSDLSMLDPGTAELVRDRVTVALQTERQRLDEERAAARAQTAEAPAVPADTGQVHEFKVIGAAEMTENRRRRRWGRG